jgi:hypothetical protein
MGLASATCHSPREMPPTDRRGRTSGTVKPLQPSDRFRAAGARVLWTIFQLRDRQPFPARRPDVGPLWNGTRPITWPSPDVSDRLLNPGKPTDDISETEWLFWVASRRSSFREADARNESADS